LAYLNRLGLNINMLLVLKFFRFPNFLMNLAFIMRLGRMNFGKIIFSKLFINRSELFRRLFIEH
jgi:hypothetical protein